MKVFSKAQIYEGDRVTEERQKLPASELMERAGLQIFNWMHERNEGSIAGNIGCICVCKVRKYRFIFFVV